MPGCCDRIWTRKTRPASRNVIRPPKQQAVDDAKHGASDPDAERERCDDRDAEGRLMSEAPETKPDVLPEVVNPRRHMPSLPLTRGQAAPNAKSAERVDNGARRHAAGGGHPSPVSGVDVVGHVAEQISGEAPPELARMRHEHGAHHGSRGRRQPGRRDAPHERAFDGATGLGLAAATSRSRRPRSAVSIRWPAGVMR